MGISDYIAGAYEDRYEYRAFLPTVICHEWIIADPQLTTLLGEADRALGELNAFSQLIPDIDFFISMYVAKEATQSSRIEGTQTNIEDAFKDADDLNPEEVDDWGEVQNYIRAINSAITALDQLPLSNRLLHQTHATLMEVVRGETKMPGEFRVSQSWTGVSLRDAAFVPPHHDHVLELMSDLEQFLRYS
jgi:Fic family protein